MQRFVAIALVVAGCLLVSSVASATELRIGKAAAANTAFAKSLCDGNKPKRTGYKGTPWHRLYRKTVECKTFNYFRDGSQCEWRDQWKLRHGSLHRRLVGRVSCT